MLQFDIVPVNPERLEHGPQKRSGCRDEEVWEMRSLPLPEPGPEDDPNEPEPTPPATPARAYPVQAPLTKAHVRRILTTTAGDRQARHQRIESECRLESAATALAGFIEGWRSISNAPIPPDELQSRLERLQEALEAFQALDAASRPAA